MEAPKESMMHEACCERVKLLEAALPDAGKLRALADWIDLKFPNDSNPEVQRDLRSWADAISRLVAPSLGNAPGVFRWNVAADPDEAAASIEGLAAAAREEA